MYAKQRRNLQKVTPTKQCSRGHISKNKEINKLMETNKIQETRTIHEISNSNSSYKLFLDTKINKQWFAGKDIPMKIIITVNRAR